MSVTNRGLKAGGGCGYGFLVVLAAVAGLTALVGRSNASDIYEAPPGGGGPEFSDTGFSGSGGGLGPWAAHEPCVTTTQYLALPPGDKGPPGLGGWVESPTGFRLPPRLAGHSGVPSTLWAGAGLNQIGTAGPSVRASVNGIGKKGSWVAVGNGASYVRQRDFYLPLNGIDWYHGRICSSLGSWTPDWQGQRWWSNEMMNISGNAGDEDDNDCDVELDPYHTRSFTNTGTGTWTCDDNYLYTLTYSSGDDEFILTRADGHKIVFHDLNVANVAGKLKRIEDAYGNDWAFTYSGSDLDYVVVDVVEGNDHKITYSYFTSGDNDGLLQYVKVYKTTTTTDANLIGQVEYVYHDSSVDDYGLEDDLMKVIVSRKATADGDGTLSISENYYYRYYKGTYDSDTNPGTDHMLRFVLLPENADRLNTAKGDPLTQSNVNLRRTTCRPESGRAGRSGMKITACLLYTSPSPRDRTRSRMPSSA